MPSRARASLALVLIAIFGLSAVSAEARTPSPAAFLSRRLHLADKASFKTAEVDLKGDGRRETIVYVTDPSSCGSGGCHLYVLEPRAGTYRIVMRATVVQTPIRLLASSHHGWRDIGVTVSGGGVAQPYEAALRFDGRRYFGNPSVPPAVPLRGTVGEVLIDR